MTKAELIAVVGEKAGLTKKDADKAVTAVLEAITETLVNGEKVSLVGFGTFEVKERAARTGTAIIEIISTNAINFFISRYLLKHFIYFTIPHLIPFFNRFFPKFFSTCFYINYIV